MQVLVVGGAGYIGSHVVLDLLDHGHQPTVFDNMSSGRQVNLVEGVPFVEGDILHQATLERLFQSISYDAVIHLAALKAAGDSMTDPETYAHHNLTGSINLINQAVLHGVRRFVFSSSAAVYGEPDYLPVDEDHPTEPTNFYGFTKLQIERQLQWFSKLRGLRYASLRYFNAAGYDARGRVKGLEVNPKNLIPAVMEVLVGNRERLKLFGTDYETRDGTCIRDYVHVTDLARAHTLALDHIHSQDQDLVVNLGSESGHTVKEVLQMAETVAGKPIPHDVVGRREGDPMSLVASSKRALEVLNWQAENTSLETLVRTTWEVYRQDQSSDR